MDDKKEKKPMTLDARAKGQPATVKGAKSTGAFSWFGGVKAEFKKITWTSKDELRTYTKVVVLSTLLVGLGIYLLDLCAQGTLSGLSNLVKAIVT